MGGVNYMKWKQTQLQKYQIIGRVSIVLEMKSGVWGATFGPTLHRHYTCLWQTAVEWEHHLPPRHAQEKLVQVTDN